MLEEIWPMNAAATIPTSRRPSIATISTSSPSPTPTVTTTQLGLGLVRRVVRNPSGVCPEFTGSSIVVDSITDYPASDLRRHLSTFARFLRESNRVAYLIVHDNAETRADRRRLTMDVADVVHTYHPSDTDQANDALRIPKLHSPRRTRRSSGSRSGSTLPTRYR
jgi:hypothetical protein